MPTTEDAERVGRLIQFALQPGCLPIDEPEYRELVRHYEDLSDFRSLVQGVCDGLGLTVLMVSERGMFLGTRPESVFAQRPSDFRGTQVSGDDRLLDGLVQVAIAATLFPRQRDLDDDVFEARRPVSLKDVHDTLAELVDVLKQELPREPDEDADRMDRGLWEAWQVFESRPSYRETESGRLGSNCIYRTIEQHLERLCEVGCFKTVKQQQTVRYRPKLRYQVLVQELAASRLYERVQQAVEAAEADRPCAAESPENETGR